MFWTIKNATLRQWLILVAANICIFAVGFTTTSIMNSLPTMGLDLHISPNNLQWAITGYTLACASLVVFAGQLGDLFGHRKIFYIGAAIFFLASLLIALSTSATLLITGRSLQGIGAAVLTPLSLSLIKFNLQEEKVAFGIATWTATLSIGYSIGPVFGGIFASFFSWRLIFWVNLPILIVGILLLLSTEEKTEKLTRTISGRIDFYGLIVFIAGLIPFMLGLSGGNTRGWDNPMTWLLILVGLVLLIFFYFVEGRVKNPLIHFQYFKNRLFVGAFIGRGLTVLLLISILYYFNFFVQTPSLLHYSAVHSGICLLPASIAIFTLAFAASFVIKYLGYRYATTIGFLFATVGFYLLYSVTAETTYLDLWPALLLIGVSIGLLMTVFSNLLINALPKEQAGEASAILSTDNYLCITIGTAISMICFLTAGRHALQKILEPMTGLTTDTKLMIDHAIIGHTMPLQILAEKMGSHYIPTLEKLAQSAALNGFKAAMLFTFILTLIGAISSFCLIRNPEKK